jgi:hypothetical protein
MPVQKASGTENLRANESIKAGKMTDSPSGSGKDCGGTANLKADEKTLQAAVRGTPSGSADKRPSGVQNFDSLAGDR